MSVKTRWFGTCALILLLAGLAAPAQADLVLFDTGAPDGKIATTSRPGVSGKIETETGDDFIASNTLQITGATFTGLIVPSGTAAPTISQVAVEIYRVFPLDSNTGRTITVPTRANSPSDVAFADRDSAANSLSFTTSTLSNSLTASNSVLNGINKSPNQTTGGEGPVTGSEVRFSVTFATPFTLPADHYFFVPQVAVTGGEFYWLSAPKPITNGFAFTPDLQSWVRNANLDPDWLRVGTDVVGGTTPPTFNASFSLIGVSVPEPSALTLSILSAAALAGLASWRRWRADRPA